MKMSIAQLPSKAANWYRRTQMVLPKTQKFPREEEHNKYTNKQSAHTQHHGTPNITHFHTGFMLQRPMIMSSYGAHFLSFSLGVSLNFPHHSISHWLSCRSYLYFVYTWWRKMKIQKLKIQPKMMTHRRTKPKRTTQREIYAFSVQCDVCAMI